MDFEVPATNFTDDRRRILRTCCRNDGIVAGAKVAAAKRDADFAFDDIGSALEAAESRSVTRAGIVIDPSLWDRGCSPRLPQMHRIAIFEGFVLVVSSF